MYERRVVQSRSEATAIKSNNARCSQGMLVCSFSSFCLRFVIRCFFRVYSDFFCFLFLSRGCGNAVDRIGSVPLRWLKPYSLFLEVVLVWRDCSVRVFSLIFFVSCGRRRFGPASVYSVTLLSPSVGCTLLSLVRFPSPAVRQSRTGTTSWRAPPARACRLPPCDSRDTEAPSKVARRGQPKALPLPHGRYDNTAISLLPIIRKLYYTDRSTHLFP